MTDLRLNQHLNHRELISVILTCVMLVACTPAPASPAPLPTSTLPTNVGGLSADEVATLNSLEQLDDFPLYTMRYFGVYAPTNLTASVFHQAETVNLAASSACQASWGCTLYAALGDPGKRLYGRNFDWRFSPALLLFTDPPDGYASVSMVDIDYLGFGGDQARGLVDLPLLSRQALLEAPALPFDGMIEQGLVVGMAAVSPGDMRPDPNKKTIDELAVMREILDHAATVDEAVDILANYNIDMGNVPLHYLIASTAGNSALVEFFQGKMVVFRNEAPWQLATNFLVASTDGQPQGQCPRYDRVSQRLQATKGQLTIQDGLRLLADVSQSDPQAQSNTQWSVVYNMTSGDINIIMGRKYTGDVRALHLNRSSQ